jgi:hypothetical protein
MAFEPNVGQTSHPVRFLARGSGYLTFLTPRRAVLVLRAPKKRRSGAKQAVGPQRRSAVHGEKASVLSMALVGARRPARMVARDELPGKSNYLIGNVPSKWHTNIPNYREVMESGVYPDINLVYFGTQGKLEYEFEIEPGGQAREIRLRVDGARKLRIDQSGNLEASLSNGVVQFHKPIAYQQADGERNLVPARYAIEGARLVTVRLGKYDHARPLVIDPTLAYSTYLGGSNIDVANSIAVASDDTAFIAGGTFSTNFPTAHPLQPSAGGPTDFPQDAFVSKISADGSTLLYSTYLGGSSMDIANGIAVDFLGDAYVTGSTTSTNFPVTPLAAFPNCGTDGACGATINPHHLIVQNGFVSKLNAAGSGLVYSSYVGYDQHVSCNAIAVDTSGIAYIVGQTTDAFVGPSFIQTTNTGFQQTYGGGTDAFLITLSATGSTVEYSTYLGGSNEDVAYGVGTDNSGEAFVAGLTYSSDFPVLNAVDPAYGGAGDAFFTKVNTNATGAASLLYSTYLGGSGLDQANAVAVDSSGNAYVAGVTASATLGPVTPVNSYAGGGDAFVAKLNPAASGAGSLVYFRYIGGSLADEANGVAVDSSGDAYITGSTVSTNFPIVQGAFQPKYGGGNDDAFVTKINPTGTGLIYSSYLGGTNTDIANAIAVDSSGSAYVTGQTCSLDFPLANPLQAASGGNCDAFISKVSTLAGVALNPAGLVFSAQSVGTTSQPQTVTVTNEGGPLTINGITLTGTNASAFAETTTCGSSLPAGGQCTISVTFTPTTIGTSVAQVAISDTAPGSPQVISLSGSTSTLELSATNLAFGNQDVGVASSVQTVTATNQGPIAITFSSIVASGAFSETDDCTKAPLQPGTNCTINVTFTPQAAGSSIGALTLSDNAPGSPQIVMLTGTGVGVQNDFTMSAQPPSATISAGQTADFTLTLTPTGTFSQAVGLTCSGLPAAASCEASSNPVTLSGPTNVTLAITTGARTIVPPTPVSRWPIEPTGPMGILLTVWLGLLLLALLLSAVVPGLRVRRTLSALALALTVTLLSAACNGGTKAGVIPGTPAGTYQVSVVGTAGSITKTTTVSLQVK